MSSTTHNIFDARDNTNKSRIYPPRERSRYNTSCKFHWWLFPPCFEVWLLNVFRRILKSMNERSPRPVNNRLERQKGRTSWEEKNCAIRLSHDRGKSKSDRACKKIVEQESFSLTPPNIVFPTLIELHVFYPIYFLFCTLWSTRYVHAARLPFFLCIFAVPSETRKALSMYHHHRC